VDDHKIEGGKERKALLSTCFKKKLAADPEAQIGRQLIRLKFSSFAYNNWISV
jgi:hypothetical protein